VDVESRPALVFARAWPARFDRILQEAICAVTLSVQGDEDDG
jgi:hypothetical protein